MTALALLLSSAFTLWWVDPYGATPYLPDAAPAGGVVTNVLSLAAARGEIETVSFSVCPARDLAKVDFVPSDLTGPDGTVIPASAADFALVKCWYRAKGRWETSWSGDTGKPTLINDLVLHDNDLIRVHESTNFAERSISVRMSYPEGDVWVDMKKHGRGNDHFRHEVFPVMDAKKFVPFDLRKGRFQQYWFTWKVPAGAKGGVYRGALAVKEDGRALASIPVELEVYPFVLPTPRTHYDTSRRFISSWMGTPTLADILRYGKDLASAERKVFNIYRSLAEHNAHEPCGPGFFAADSTDDLNVRSLILMRRAGMDCDTLIGGSSGDFSWAVHHESPFVSPEEDPALYAKVRAAYRAKLGIQATVLDRCLGHRNNYFCGPDECGSYTHRILYGFYSDIHRLGMDTWGDYGVAADVAWSLGMDDVPASARHTEAWSWHRGSARAVTYAGTFTGPSCPDIWRRTKGLRYYYADFDGLHEYVLYYNRWNHWNDFTWRGAYTQMQIVYPVYDGIVETLAWQGVREALDDIRYLSLLRLRAEAAMKSSDPKVKAAGRRHFVWMDLQDPERILDLFAFRREVARRAMDLIALAGPEPEERPVRRPAPELPDCTYGANVPVNEETARAFAANNRYDLAIPMWAKLMDDETRPSGRRVEAAIAKAALEAEILRREDALKTLDAALAWKGLDGADRGRLLLRRVRTMLTDRVYEEEYAVGQLDAAADVLAKALARRGTAQGERFEAILRLSDAYLAGGAHAEAIAFAEARMRDAKLDDPEKCELFLREARACASLKRWDEAAKAYRLARQVDTRRICESHANLDAEGFVAEQRRDWKTAQRCYGDQIRRFGSEEEDLKRACIGRLRRVTKKLAESERNKPLDVDAAMNGEETLDLDE